MYLYLSGYVENGTSRRVEQWAVFPGISDGMRALMTVAGILPSMTATAATAASIASPPSSSTAYPALSASLNAASYLVLCSGVDLSFDIVPAPPCITRVYRLVALERRNFSSSKARFSSRMGTMVKRGGSHASTVGRRPRRGLDVRRTIMFAWWSGEIRRQFLTGNMGGNSVIMDKHLRDNSINGKTKLKL